MQWHVVVVMTALGLGFGVGRWSMEPAEIERPPPVKCAETSCTPLTWSSPPTQLCVVPKVPDLTAAWCQAQLNELQRRDRRVRRPWPEDLGFEEPSVWTDRVERAFEQCDLPWTLDVVDCTEYPCAASVALREGFEPPQDAMAELDRCPLLTELEFDVNGQTVRCPDGHEEQAYTFTSMQQQDLPWMAQIQVFSRRMDDLAALHQCTPL